MQEMSEQEVSKKELEQEIDLRVEELEEVIAPKLAANHNETFVMDTSA